MTKAHALPPQTHWFSSRSPLAARARRRSALGVLLIGLTFGTDWAVAQTAVAGAPPGPSAGPVLPLDLIRSSISRVVEILQSQAPGTVLTADRRGAIRQVAEDMFDFDEMARRTLVSHWKDRSPQEQAEFVRLFMDLLERSYLTMIGNYPLAAMTFQGESISGENAQVRSRVSTDRGMELSTEYRLLRRGDRWAVYDVVADGVSLVANYRSQFNSIIRTTSFAGLLEKLRTREASALTRPGPDAR